MKQDPDILENVHPSPHQNPYPCAISSALLFITMYILLGAKFPTTLLRDEGPRIPETGNGLSSPKLQGSGRSKNDQHLEKDANDRLLSSYGTKDAQNYHNYTTRILPRRTDGKKLPDRPELKFVSLSKWWSKPWRRRKKLPDRPELKFVSLSKWW